MYLKYNLITSFLKILTMVKGLKLPSVIFTISACQSQWRSILITVLDNNHLHYFRNVSSSQAKTL